MPHYFFDIDDGRRRVHDGIGSKHADSFAARQKAESLLRTLQEILLIEGRSGPASVKVRDGEDALVYEGSVYPKG